MHEEKNLCCIDEVEKDLEVIKEMPYSTHTLESLCINTILQVEWNVFGWLLVFFNAKKVSLYHILEIVHML